MKTDLSVLKNSKRYADLQALLLLVEQELSASGHSEQVSVTGIEVGGLYRLVLQWGTVAAEIDLAESDFSIKTRPKYRALKALASLYRKHARTLTQESAMSKLTLSLTPSEATRPVLHVDEVVTGDITIGGVQVWSAVIIADDSLTVNHCRDDYYSIEMRLGNEVWVFYDARLAPMPTSERRFILLFKGCDYFTTMEGSDDKV